MTGRSGLSYSAHLNRHAVVLRSVRLYLALGVGMLLGVGALLDRSGVLAVDPRALRYGMAAAMACVLGATFVSAWTRAHVREVLLGLAVVTLVWLGTLLALNDFAPALGPVYFTMVFTGGALLAIAFRGITATLLFLAMALGGAAGAAAWSDAPATDPGLFLICLGASSTVILVTAAIRERLMQSVERGQRLYAEAEAAGGIGSWVLDMSTGEARWSDGLCALLGVPPLGNVPAPALNDYVHADDLPAANAAFDVVARGDLDEHAVTVRITTVDGRGRTLRGVVRAERDDDGRVARVVGVSTDVTAQAAHQAELVDALDRAEAAARLKEAILANMSHEIRTPLTAVIGYAELLADEAGPDLAPLVEPIVSGGQRLLDTLNSVLDLARLEADGSTLALRPVDLAAAAERARSVHAEAAARAGLSLGVEAEEAWALADEAAVGRIFDNLISNAIRFTATGSITLRIGANADHAVMQVLDTGRGMSPAFTAHAAEAFVQESTGEARSHEGFGLGLTIVERLVDAMLGRLRITSAPGAGTRVRVALPRATSEALAVPRSEEPVWIARRRLAPLAALETVPAYRTRTTGTETTAPPTRAETT